MIPRTMTSQEASSLRLPLSYLARIPELKVCVKYENKFKHKKFDISFICVHCEKLYFIYVNLCPLERYNFFT